MPFAPSRSARPEDTRFRARMKGGATPRTPMEHDVGALGTNVETGARRIPSSKFGRYPIHIGFTFGLGTGFIRIAVHVLVEPICLSVTIDAARLTTSPHVRHIANDAFFVRAAHGGRDQRFAYTFERDERRAFEVTNIGALLFFGP